MMRRKGGAAQPDLRHVVDASARGGTRGRLHPICRRALPRYGNDCNRKPAGYCRGMVDPDSSPHPQGSPFWRFSLSFYRQPGVAESCLRLQDEAGADVNLLCYLLWHAALERRLTAADVALIEQRIAPWRAQVVVPLRMVRRALKTPPAAMPPAAAEAYRGKVKALELEAERLQQEALYDLAQASRFGEPAASPEAAARANLDAYQVIAPRPFPAAAVSALLAAFSTFQRRAGADQGAH
jgi:uncharacterized protein (TIGR02444 family)